MFHFCGNTETTQAGFTVFTLGYIGPMNQCDRGELLCIIINDGPTNE